MARFVIGMKLKSEQKELVSFQRRYLINPSRRANKLEQTQQLNAQDVLRQFQPMLDPVDNQLY